MLAVDDEVTDIERFGDSQSDCCHEIRDKKADENVITAEISRPTMFRIEQPVPPLQVVWQSPGKSSPEAPESTAGVGVAVVLRCQALGV
ncbi:MAG: hypothetical protein ACI8PP_000219 [Candidatus Pseudothioglobus sp.]|jgi:hypothetical protein